MFCSSQGCSNGKGRKEVAPLPLLYPNARTVLQVPFKKAAPFPLQRYGTPDSSNFTAGSEEL